MILSITCRSSTMRISRSPRAFMCPAPEHRAARASERQGAASSPHYSREPLLIGVDAADHGPRCIGRIEVEHLAPFAPPRK